MTIDSSWIACFKEEVPEAFRAAQPFRAKAVFCDGQIRLMRGNDWDFMTWDQYVWHQFHSHLKRFYEDGADTVILAFDDYAHVPEAKCMTQTKRRKHLPKLEILEREPLPPTVPSGEKWAQSIANRFFKTKVIAMVIQELPRALKLTPTQTLIIDYAGTPEEYKMVDGELRTRPLPDLAPLGEADIKFTRYAEIYRDLLVDSVDGDSIPIALIHQELAFSDLTMGTMRSEDLAGAPPRICIRRITTRVDPLPKKRAKTEPAKRTFEYVNIPLLYHALRDILLQCTGRVDAPLHSKHYMCMLLGLIGLTGTDYTRSMPQVSGKTLFNLLPDLWVVLMRVYRPETGQLDVDCTADLLVAAVYANKYSAHVKASPSLQHVLLALRASKLSERTRDSLPDVPRVKCTVRNINWLIRYWRDPALVPDPLACEEGLATFGYVRRRGVVEYSH